MLGKEIMILCFMMKIRVKHGIRLSDGMSALNPSLKMQMFFAIHAILIHVNEHSNNVVVKITNLLNTRYRNGLKKMVTIRVAPENVSVKAISITNNVFRKNRTY